MGVPAPVAEETQQLPPRTGAIGLLRGDPQNRSGSGQSQRSPSGATTGRGDEKKAEWLGAKARGKSTKLPLASSAAWRLAPSSARHWP